MTKTTKTTQQEREQLKFPVDNWVSSSPFSPEQDERLHQLIPGNSNVASTKFLKMCHMLQKYRELNGSSRILQQGLWTALNPRKHYTKRKYSKEILIDSCKLAIESIDPDFFKSQVSLILTYLFIFPIVLFD